MTKWGETSDKRNDRRIRSSLYPGTKLTNAAG